MLLSLIFWLSCSSLAVEILLARIFAITQWHHLSFMVISLVMFGFAAGGTYWSLHTLAGTPADLQHRAARLAAPMAVFYAASVLVGLLVVIQLPLDYLRMPVEPIQLGYLMGLYPLLALPFFITGLMLALTFAALPEQTGRIYCATMTGSAVGVLVPGGLLPLVSEVPLTAGLALLPLLGYGLTRLARIRRDQSSQSRNPWGMPLAVLIVVGLGGLFLTQPTWLELAPNPYKALSQVRQFPDTMELGPGQNSLQGRLQRVASPYLRYAPGLSLQFTAPLPVPEVTYRDGDAPTYLYPIPRAGHPPKDNFARQTLSYSGYIYRPQTESVLLIIRNGGLSAACALADPGRDILLVAQDPRLARHLGAHYQLPASPLRPRRFLTREQAHYDLIHLENWGYSLPGTAALEQDYLLTREALAEMLRHLTDEGILVLSRRLLLPPSDGLRLWATAYQALEQLPVPSPARHLAVFRNWDTVTFLIGRQPLADLSHLLTWMEGRNFDPVYLPGGVPTHMVNRFNQFEAPFLHDDIRMLAAAMTENRYDRFLESRNLDLAPRGDLRPYPHRFLKWTRLTHLYQATGQRFYTLWMSGELVVMVVLGLALVSALLFLGLPLPGTRRAPGGITAGTLGYFLAVGIGFIGVEIYLIHIYTLLTGHPVVSLALTLGGMLFFAGLGGLRVQKRGATVLKGDLLRLVALLAVWQAVTPWLLNRLLALPEMVSWGLAVGWAAPVAFFMGVPFSGGLVLLGQTARQRCYGWSLNGIASVVGAVAAVPVALTWGDPALVWAGIGAYGAAWLCIRKR